ncbi:MAG: hypothetical protein QNJ09_12895 [Paracoccaceae bacterium]|nr:hypothetical protein [Paracoccaceae bacterium]
MRWRTEKRGPWQGAQRVIIHLGFRKTGSTSIQQLLAMNAGLLPDGFVASPRADLTKPFRKIAAEHAEAPQPKALRRAGQELRDAVEGIAADTLLISDENLIGQSMVTADGRTLFDLAVEVLPVIETAFGDAPLEFVAYTRDRTGWLRSAYNQAVKRSGVVQQRDDWIAGMPDRLDWQAGLDQLRGVLKAPLSIFAMEDDLAGEAPLMGRALLMHAGLTAEDLAGLERPGRSNESLGPGALQFLLKLNALGLPSKDRRRVARLVEDNPGLFAA